MARQPETVGRYEIRSELGAGGFATVYRAYDPVLDREVALKVLHPHLARDPDIRQRFVREGRALARVDHPNIVPVHDAGEVDGGAYLAMKLLRGRPLDEIVAERGPLPLAQVVPIAEQVAGALAALHALQLVHRDIKPENIVLEADTGRAVLLDLGVARDLASVTMSGAFTFGTPAYMAPEQTRWGGQVTPRTDVYQLGATVYQLLTGRAPFIGDPTQVLDAVQHHDPPPLTALRPDLPPSVVAAVARAMAKDPAERPASAPEFAALLHAGLPATAAGGHDAEVLAALLRERLPGGAGAPAAATPPGGPAGAAAAPPAAEGGATTGGTVRAPAMAAWVPQVTPTQRAPSSPPVPAGPDDPTIRTPIAPPAAPAVPPHPAGGGGPPAGMEAAPPVKPAAPPPARQAGTGRGKGPLVAAGITVALVMLAAVALVAVLRASREGAEDGTRGRGVSTVAGSGAKDFADGQGAAARFNAPTGVAVDGAGNIYVADSVNHRVRKIAPAGAVTTLAGIGERGFADGAGTAARFSLPTAVAVDGAGNVYVADSVNNRVRKIAPDGRVSTLAGGDQPGGTDGPGGSARFDLPMGVAVDGAGNVYVAEYAGHRIRKITPQGTVSTLAGAGTPGLADGQGTAARFNAPVGVAVDGAGNVYVADSFNHRIRKVTPDGTVTTIAGGGEAGEGRGGFADGPAGTARFNEPLGVAVDRLGNVYVADAGNNRIRRITTRGVETLAGSGDAGFADGPPATAQFRGPQGVAIDRTGGTLYIADTLNHRIRALDRPGPR